MMEPELGPRGDGEREAGIERRGHRSIEQTLDRVDAMITAHPHLAAVCAAAVGGLLGYLWPRGRSEMAAGAVHHGRARAFAGTAARRAGSIAMTTAMRAAARRMMSQAAGTLH